MQSFSLCNITLHKLPGIKVLHPPHTQGDGYNCDWLMPVLPIVVKSDGEKTLAEFRIFSCLWGRLLLD